jgi:hypothetical protein
VLLLLLRIVLLLAQGREHRPRDARPERHPRRVQ